VTGVPRSRAVLALGFVSLISFAVAAHLTIVHSSGEPILGAWLSLIPVAAFAGFAVRRSRRPLAALAGVVVAIVVLWIAWSRLEHNFLALFFVENAGANLALAILFGRTLTGDREALCTRFARLMHGTLPLEVERYTRNVTVAWTLFFTAIFVISCVLYVAGFVVAWSLFANILSPVLVAGMFVVEYLVRHRALPDWERSGVLGGIHAFVRHFGTAQPEGPR
jgi:uncharacterized membrane protein